MRNSDVWLQVADVFATSLQAPCCYKTVSTVNSRSAACLQGGTWPGLILLPLISTAGSWTKRGSRVFWEVWHRFCITDTLHGKANPFQGFVCRHMRTRNIFLGKRIVLIKGNFPNRGGRKNDQAGKQRSSNAVWGWRLIKATVQQMTLPSKQWVYKYLPWLEES